MDSKDIVKNNNKTLQRLVEKIEELGCSEFRAIVDKSEVTFYFINQETYRILRREKSRISDYIFNTAKERLDFPKKPYRTKNK
ncbi:MAG: hypothetical protein Q8Q04_03625 [archaeon]|nr:hypothetical protein [archaeon]